MMNAYILNDDHAPKPAVNMLEWAEWYATADRVVSHTLVAPGVNVSTVFVGLDHAHNCGPPLLWATMVFGGTDNGFCRRYSTREEALGGHTATSRILQDGLLDDT